MNDLTYLYIHFIVYIISIVIIGRLFIVYYWRIETNRKKIIKIMRMTGEKYIELQYQLDMLFHSNKEIILLYDNKIKDIVSYHNKLAEKLHSNIMNIQEMIGKTNCESLHIIEKMNITKIELEEKNLSIIQMQENIGVYIKHDIDERKKHCISIDNV